jgi:hypothetical protein
MLRSESQQKLEILREQRQFFINEINNNREAETEISVVTHSTTRLKDDYNKLLSTVDHLANEVSKVLYRYQFHSKLFLVFSSPHPSLPLSFNTEAVLKHLCCSMC